MSRALFLGTLLFAGPFLNMSWAQNKTDLPVHKNDISMGIFLPGRCSLLILCPGGEATQVIKLRLYLGTVSFDGNQNARLCSTNSTREHFPTRAVSA
jgi:hypothetical protein